MATDFYAAKINTKKPTPFVPRPTDAGKEALVLLNATIPASCNLPKGTRISLLVKTEDCDNVALATLIASQHDNAKLDVALDMYAEFSVMGPPSAEIHISGHYMPKEGARDDEDDEDEGNPFVQAFKGLMGAPSGYNPDEDDSDGEDADIDDTDEIIEAGGAGLAELAARRKYPKRVEITEVKDGQEGDENNGDDEDDVDDTDREEEEADEPVEESQGRRNQASVEDMGNEEDDEEEEEEEEDDDDGGGDNDDDDDDDENDDEDDDDDDANEMDTDEEEAEEEEEEAVAVKENGWPPQPQAVKESKRANTVANAAPPPKRMKHTKFANGFEVQQIQDSANPSAPQAQLGKTVVVKYRGRLPNGKVFDETKGHKTFSFRLGVGEVIKGWDKGVTGMRVGDKRKLTVPPSMAYGSTGVPGVIPKDSTLHFEVELVRVKDAKR